MRLVDIARALLEGMLQQPVDDADDVLVVRIGLGLGAELEHLLEIAHVARRTAPGGAGAAYGARHRVELTRETRDIARVGQHTSNTAARDLLEVGLPGAHVGLGARDGDLLITDAHGEDAVAFRERS